jgi:hypothetical protein
LILPAGGLENNFLHDKNSEVYYNSKCYTFGYAPHYALRKMRLELWKESEEDE